MELHEKRDDLKIKNCVFPNSEFDDVNMSNTQFNNINLSVARITQANLSNGGITNATPSNVAIQDRQLVGMTINGIPVHEMLADHKAAKG